ncbi:hypothetical protein NFI96_006426 [Prochilodus magdalenae]|nr:hypothetical protein NFI96_006426 [Prochilodus magdalenae]
MINGLAAEVSLWVYGEDSDSDLPRLAQDSLRLSQAHSDLLRTLPDSLSRGVTTGLWRRRLDLGVAVIGPLGSDLTKTYRFRATEGRYVNVLLPGENKILTLCEVEVFADTESSPESFHLHEEEDLHNVALRGRATQSSVHSSEMSPGFCLAQNAIDDNRDPDLKKGSCTQTEQESSPWWRLSLHRSHVVSYVALTNRGDCCSERLGGAEIRVGDSLSNDGKDNPL